MQSIKPGLNWTGDYSRFTAATAAAKRYFALLKEREKPILDDEFNALQDMLLTSIRSVTKELLGDGSFNDGFRIEGTGLANDFVIHGGGGTVDTAGVLYIAGMRLILPSDTTYSAQEIAPPPLTTPVLPRTDEVYVDVWLDEAGPVEDPDMVDPTLGSETSRRLKLRWSVLVEEGGVTPPDYVDPNGLVHHTLRLATIERDPVDAIDAGMVVDQRGNPQLSASVASAVAAHLAAANPHPQYATDGDLASEIGARTAGDAGLQGQLDALSAVVVGKVDKSGDEMDGDLNFNGNSVKGLPPPIDPGDAARKDYVDTVGAALQAQIDALAGSASIGYVDAEVAAEAAARTAADDALSARIDEIVVTALAAGSVSFQINNLKVRSRLVTVALGDGDSFTVPAVDIGMTTIATVLITSIGGGIGGSVGPTLGLDPISPGDTTFTVRNHDDAVATGFYWLAFGF